MGRLHRRLQRSVRRLSPEQVRGLSLHEFRVALRRLEAGLPLFRRKETASLKKACREALSALGPVRDRALLQPWLRRHRAVLSLRRLTAERSGDRLLHRAAEAVWIERWPLLAREAERAAVRSSARRRRQWRQALRRVARRRRKVVRRRTMRALHRWRLAIKKARYLAEWLERPASEVAPLARSQHQLGALHDLWWRSSRVARGDRSAQANWRGLCERREAMRRRAIEAAVLRSPP